MDHNEREFFLYRILSGVVNCSVFNRELFIFPPTKEIYREACERYQTAYIEFLNEGLMTQEEMSEKMMEMNLWSWHKDKDMENVKTSIEDTKLLAYENKSDKAKLRQFKNFIFLATERYEEYHKDKHLYFHKTCEGMASKEKLLHIIKKCTYTKNKKKFLFRSISPSHLMYDYNDFHSIEESVIRDLARNEPWRLSWSIRENSGKPLIFYPELELTNNQKSLIAWSQTYDNVYESIEAPSDEVIQDDILLDGWFIKQSRSRKLKSGQEDLDKSIKNPKIRNAQEVYKVVGDDKEAAKKIESLNSPFASMIKKQRESLINSRGSAEQQDLLDEKLRASQQIK
jgi:hypothetical protein